MNEYVRLTTRMAAAEIRMESQGVLNLEWVICKISGACFCSASANGSLVHPNIVAFREPVIDNTAPIVMTKAPKGPAKRWAASTRGLSEFANPGNVPIHITWIRIYIITTKIKTINMLNGKLRLGSLTSPALMVEISNPVKANTKIIIALDKE